ncbi:MAG: DUF1501 domain-containing protein [Planctomycetaceae bacterium]|nr:DUF1501 domain-containing protein [Planctomycetaceae bacterium]
MNNKFSRREFTQTAALTGAAALAGRQLHAAPSDKPPKIGGRAKSCIFLWMGGGMCHVDTFDPKQTGDPKTRKAGSAYPSIPTAIKDVRVCEHLPLTANLLDRSVVMRSLNHPISSEHAAPTNLFKTGRPTSGTIVYPSLGSIISHELGPQQPGIPAYLVMGYPSVTRGPGFLGAKHSYIYLTDTESGPNGLQRPADVTDVRQRRRLETLSKLRQQFLLRNSGDQKVENYDQTIAAALKLAGPQFTSVFDLDRESATVRERYGNEFGQRCLLARRLVQAGVRFVDVSYNLNFVNGTGWDTHRDGQVNQHGLIQGLDKSLSALIEDLEEQKLLDDTLVVLATEFGRPPEFDGGGGRRHQSAAFTTLFFGGGLKTGQVVGATDEEGKKIIDRPISLADWHATIHTAMGIDPTKELYDGERPVPITDHGRPITEVFV